jgi:hypothetical protein
MRNVGTMRVEKLRRNFMTTRDALPEEISSKEAEWINAPSQNRITTGYAKQYPPIRSSRMP